MNTFRLLWGAAALALLTPLVQANEPYYYGGYGYGGHGYGGYSGYGCGSVPGCCDHPISRADHIWDNYCQEKWCHHVPCSHMQPWWHPAPSAGHGGCSCGSGSCHTGGCAAPVSTNGSFMNTSYGGGRAANGSNAAPRPATAADQPPAPPAPPMGEEPLQLRLQSKKRPSGT
jgi:hypothetical protein